MEVDACTSVLLLDLDGVVALECKFRTTDSLELIRLHKLIDIRVQAVTGKIAVLTHRSKKEARRLLKAAGVDSSKIEAVFAAEDIAIAAIKAGRGLELLRDGLKKSFVLPEVERRFSVKKQHIAFIDDQRTNLDDVLSCGVGLGLLAPSSFCQENNVVRTFALDELTRILSQWRAGEGTGGLISLAPVDLTVEPWMRTGVSATNHRSVAFNFLRRVSKYLRQHLNVSEEPLTANVLPGRLFTPANQRLRQKDQ